MGSQTDDVTVWVMRVANVTPQTLARWQAVLDVRERAQAQRINSVSDRESYVAAHALLRGLLETIGGRPGCAWTLRTTDGRPEAVAGGVVGPQFSLTHTDGLAACAVSPTHPLGIDAEARERKPVIPEVWEEILAPSELGLLRAAPIERRDELFLRLWTLREAYAKATGKGVRFPRESFAFRLDPAAILFSSGAQGRAAEWQLSNWTTEQHILSLAIRSGAHQAAIVERTLEHRDLSF